MKFCFILAALTGSLFAQIGPAGRPQILAPPPTTPAAAALPPETVVANIDGHPVTVAQVRELLDAQSDPRVKAAFQQNPKYVIQQLFVMHYLADQGEKLKLADKSPLKEQLDSMRASIVAQAMVNEERNAYPVSEKQIDDYYAANQPRFEQAKIKVIYVAYKPAAPAAKAGATPEATQDAARAALDAAHPANTRTEAEAKTLADGLVKQLRGGADFAKLVGENSDDSTSKAAGGDFPIIKQSSPYPQDLKTAVFAMKPNDISEPVRQPSGFYIIQLKEKSVQPVNEVSEQIIQVIRQQHMGEWMGEITKRFDPKIENPGFFMHPNLGK